MTVPDIARERSTSRQNIQILVDKLEAGGRVESMANPAHKRSALVRLTSEGTQWLVANEPGYRHFLSEIGAELSQSEIQSGLSVLRRIHKLLLNEREGDKDRPPAKRRASITNQIPPGLAQKAGSEPVEEEFPVNLL
jgi:hypothetical protein